MSRAVKITENQWFTIQLKIATHYPKSVLMIREKMKKVLGFTTRTNRYYDANKYEWIEEIYLDFFNEPKRTMFLLKYSDILNTEPIVLRQI